MPDLGRKYECAECGAKFYDLGKAEPICPRCGTTVAHAAEVFPGVRAIAGGTFDDRAWFTIERHAWTRSACPWARPCRQNCTPSACSGPTSPRAKHMASSIGDSQITEHSETMSWTVVRTN